MKFLLDNWVLVLAALASGGVLLWQSLWRAGGGNAVSPAEAVRLMNREKGVLIDIGEPTDYAAGHAVGARNIPLATLDGGARGLPTNKALPLLLICRTGARATRAVGLLKKQGYERVSAVGGGLAAWREASLPTEKA